MGMGHRLYWVVSCRFYILLVSQAKGKPFCKLPPSDIKSPGCQRPEYCCSTPLNLFHYQLQMCTVHISVAKLCNIFHKIVTIPYRSYNELPMYNRVLHYSMFIFTLYQSLSTRISISWLYQSLCLSISWLYKSLSTVYQYLGYIKA